MSGGAGDVLSAMNDLDASEAKLAEMSADVAAADETTDAHVDDVEQAIIIDQETHSEPLPLVMVLPDAIWFVELGEGEAPKVSTYAYQATFGVSGDPKTVNYRWPDMENLGLAGYAFFKPGFVNFDYFKSWPDHIILGSLIYWLQERNDVDASLRVIAPGYSQGSESIPIILNQVSFHDRVASNYPCDTFSDNGSPIRVLTDIQPYSLKPLTVSSGGCISHECGEGSFVSLRDHRLSSEQVLSVVSSELVGEPFSITSAVGMSADMSVEVKQLASHSTAKFEISENHIFISPGISIQSWMENALINAEE